MNEMFQVLDMTYTTQRWKHDRQLDLEYPFFLPNATLIKGSVPSYHEIMT